jgi:enamine deaminase RidA (YjgF/YER057c/UK114 family)
VRVFGMVNASPDFRLHPKVIDGCSDLLVAVLGDKGRHPRCAVGMSSLPHGMSVEVEATFAIR